MADELNFQLPPKGFNSYLDGIIPDDQAVLAGAFATSMQQISNIDSVDVQQLAQIVYSIENMAGLPFTNGTDIPTDLILATFAKSQTALGSGVYGTFTNSNFFGCMSGLPYPLKPIYDSIKKLETQILTKIYQNLYLAVQWEPATASVNYNSYQVEVSPGIFETYYNITGVTLTNPGGGYLRDNTAPPTITIDGGSGATAVLTVGTDPNNVGHNGSGQYGRVLTISLTSSGTDTTTIPSATISTPLGPGWPGMNAVIQNYIDAANTEILAIKNSSAANFKAANVLDAYWNITGTALKQEQRARYNFAPPVPIPYDRWLTVAPVSLYVFVDSIPDLAKKTLPHLAAQTLEHISNIRNTGGQSVVGLMRQERNQERLSRIGIELYNNIPDSLTLQQQKMLLTNGTIPGATDGVPSPAGKFYTLPAWPTVEQAVSGNPCDDDVRTEPASPEPIAIFDVNTQTLRQVSDTVDGNISAILDNNCLGPYRDGTGPAVIINGRLLPGLPPPAAPCGELPNEIIAEFDISPCVDENGLVPLVVVNTKVPVSDSPILEIDPPGIFGPVSLPPNLNTAYTGTTLIPSTYDINDAIDKVIECNCDCWIN